YPRGSKMRERHWPPPRAVPPKREYLDGGCRKGGLGGRAAGVAQAHTFFMKEKSQRLTSLSLTGDMCLIAGLPPPNIGSCSRRGFLNKKLHYPPSLQFFSKYFIILFFSNSNYIFNFKGFM
ncbi:hypothetical protein, partial [Cetobacterium sp.]|uniref:hypothetical protein n=1 Tax=Cetobacterium sp. TaxID=2071632 RepID=UPI003EE59A48